MVTTTEGITDQVHRGRQNPVESKLAYLITNTLSYHIGSLTIPCRSQRHRSHEVGGIIIIVIPVALGVHTQSLLGVGAIGLRDAQTGHTIGTTSCSWELSLIVEVHAATQYKMTLLLEGQGIQHLIDSFRPQLLGRRTKAVAAQNSYSHKHYTKLMNRISHF